MTVIEEKGPELSGPSTSYPGLGHHAIDGGTRILFRIG